MLWSCLNQTENKKGFFGRLLDTVNPFDDDNANPSSDDETEPLEDNKIDPLGDE